MSENFICAAGLKVPRLRECPHCGQDPNGVCGRWPSMAEAQIKTLTAERDAALARGEDAKERCNNLELVLAKHHKGACELGLVKLPGGPGGDDDWFEIDMSAGYGDSTLCEETISVLWDGDASKKFQTLRTRAEKAEAEIAQLRVDYVQEQVANDECMCMLEDRALQLGKKDAEIARLRSALKLAHHNFIDAWEALPTGLYTVGMISRWLAETMKPAVERARAALEGER